MIKFKTMRLTSYLTRLLKNLILRVVEIKSNKVDNKDSGKVTKNWFKTRKSKIFIKTAKLRKSKQFTKWSKLSQCSI